MGQYLFGASSNKEFELKEAHQAIKLIENAETDQASLLFTGYIRQFFLTIPKCVMRVVIKYLMITHNLNLIIYASNKEKKLGHIYFINTCLSLTNRRRRRWIMLDETYDINHKMTSCDRAIHFAKNVRFQHYNKHRIYTTIFYAKNVIKQGNVEAILIDPFTYKIDKILHLPFRANHETQDIKNLLYCYAEDTLIAIAGMWNNAKLLLLDLNHSIYNEWKWKPFATNLKANEEFICNPCLIDNIYNNKVCIMDSNGGIKLFDLQSELWNDQILFSLHTNRVRHSFGICWNHYHKRCYIAGGHNKYNYNYSDYYDFVKDKWYKLPNTINAHTMDPIVWMEDNNILFVLNKQLSGHGSFKQIEFYDIRCNENNKWRFVSKGRQLDNFRDIIKSNLLTVFGF